MSDVIKMDYNLMEEMNEVFRRGAEQLETTQREVQNIAKALEDGALLGRGGEAFQDALTQKMCPSITRLKDKFEELAMDVYGALVDLRDSDHTAMSRFK
ncbi:MAG: WXG100 family type VII secretion target [Anaerolineales bacterium]|nr:WXG100 family type VII secretion target [Anaerolineales bacterium]